MAEDGINFAGAVAGTFEAAQGSIDKVVNDVQHIDWDAASKQAGQDTENAFEEAKGAVEKSINDLQHVDWEGVSKHIGKDAEDAVETVKEALGKAMSDTQQPNWAKAAEALQKNGATVFDAAKRAFDQAIEGLQNVKWEEVPEAIMRYIEEHPGLTAIQVGALLLVVCPFLLSIPALAAVGFSSIGPVAGSFAAWHMSVYGTGFVFSALQSAARAGYGAVVVNGIIQGFAIAAVVVSEVLKHTDAKELRGDSSE